MKLSLPLAWPLAPPHLMDGALTDGGNFADGWDFVESVACASIRGRRLEPDQPFATRA
jgi:hypothetical protein